MRTFELQRRRKFGYVASKNFIRTRPLSFRQTRVNVAPEYATTCQQLTFPDGEGSGYFFIELLHKDAVVGRLSFILDAPDETVQCMQSSLHVTVGSFENVDVVKELRGWGGGLVLMREMLRVLDEEHVQFVLLKHLDLGTGKLVRYYNNLGFHFAREVLPCPDAFDSDHMVVETATLRRLLDRPPESPPEARRPRWTRGEM